jgi:nucleoside-diphosphate-sugar epimerase
MAPRILFNGGSGKVGRHVVAWLADRGYEILNFDRVPLSGSRVLTLIGDITGSEQPTAEFLRQWCPRMPCTRPLMGDEAPLSHRKAREVLGFREEHPWR